MSAGADKQSKMRTQSGRELVRPSPDVATHYLGFSRAERFINRELSWLAFNLRVIEEAENASHPVLEQLNFLAISASNLDEFFMVRVAGLIGQKLDGAHELNNELSQEGLTPDEQLVQIVAQTRLLWARQEQNWPRIMAALKQQGVHLLTKDDMAGQITEAQKNWLADFFLAEIFSHVKMQMIKPKQPFPFIAGRDVAMMCALHRLADNQNINILMTLPHHLPRFIKLPQDEMRPDETHFIKVEDIIFMFSHYLFPNYDIVGAGLFRLLRDSDIDITDIEEDVVQSFETALKKRQRGQPVRLEIDHKMPAPLRALICDRIKCEHDYIFENKTIIGMEQADGLYHSLSDRLKFPPLVARFPERVSAYQGDYFAAIAVKDMIIHHPFESFDVVVQFLQQAATDPDVMSIQQTLYRTSHDSPIVEALIVAAENGKAVTALIELKARFNEEENIRFARDLERAGVRVVFGFIELKTHAKFSLIARREHGALKHYAHLGTGNYHPRHAKTYTDLSLFTADAGITSDVSQLFELFTDGIVPQNMAHISFSPINLRAELHRHIDAEIALAKSGQPAIMWAKMNALVDGHMIDKLYEASQAGVNITLIVRGICCLRAGVAGLSENIKVKSMIGRFLEHARIICFGNGAALPSPRAKVFISSADWMPRNLNRRVEIFTPIHNETVKEQVVGQIMRLNVADERQSWVMHPDGHYRRVMCNDAPISAHDYFMTNPSLSGRGTSTT